MNLPAGKPEGAPHIHTLIVRMITDTRGEMVCISCGHVKFRVEKP